MTYQAASGAGAANMRELVSQMVPIPCLLAPSSSPAEQRKEQDMEKDSWSCGTGHMCGYPCVNMCGYACVDAIASCSIPSHAAP